MHTTGRNTLLIVLFVVVFAVMFAVEVLQAGGNSVPAHLHSTSTVQTGVLLGSLHHTSYPSALTQILLVKSPER